MKWAKDDYQIYKKGKEYFDTVIVPLIPFQMSPDVEVENNAFKSEVISIFASEIEKELSGRVLLIPSYIYLKNANKDEEVTRLNHWVEEIHKQPFKQIFFLSFDSTWKKVEKDLQGNLLWLPGVQTGDLQSEQMHDMIRGQVKEICELIRSYW